MKQPEEYIKRFIGIPKNFRQTRTINEEQDEKSISNCRYKNISPKNDNAIELKNIVIVENKEQLFKIIEALKFRHYSYKDINRIINGENIIEVFFDRVYMYIMNLPNCYKSNFPLKTKEDCKNILNIENDIEELELIWNEKIEKIQSGSEIKENLK